MTEHASSPASRREDLTAVLTRLRDDGPVHYIDCDRLDVHDYGLRQGVCDCTATSDVDVALAEIERLSDINRGLVRDFNGYVVLNARLSREMEALGKAPGWSVSAVDLLDAMHVDDLLAGVKRRAVANNGVDHATG